LGLTKQKHTYMKEEMKKTHFDHVGSVRVNRIEEMNHALSSYHTCSDVKKLRFTPVMPDSIKELVLNALAVSEGATNHFLAEIASFKRREAEAKLERHLAGVQKRRGKRGPNSRTRYKEEEASVKLYAALGSQGNGDVGRRILNEVEEQYRRLEVSGA